MTHQVDKYRPDIDGLRAVAIVPVVAFHAFPAWVPGGFVGVDVFFVISGYLISLIILERLDDGTFTLSNFYARRARRIFPALALVLAVCLAWGWFGLFANDYAQLGKHTAAGAGFAANLVLWSEAGYFDRVSEAKPLLHLWSLGIEEQFYLLWPTLLVVAWGRRLPLMALMTGVGGASFLYNAVLVRTDEIAAFYSPFTRLWELLLGGGAAYLTLARTRPAFARFWTGAFWRLYSPGLRNTAAAIGLAMVIAAVLLFNADTSFPGWRAALPTVGTLLVISAGGDAWLNRRFLALGPMVALGLISYPLYLWHWPLLSFATLASGTSPATTRAALVVASVVLAWITYVVVERPIRFTWRGRGPVAAVLVVMIAAGMAGYVTFAQEGFLDRPINRSDKARFLEYYERLRARGLGAAYRAECDFMDWTTEETRAAIDPSCTVAGERGTVFLWGDSHAQALSPGLRSTLPAGMRLAQVTTSGCAPRLQETETVANGRCAIANAYARERIAILKPEIVILAQIMRHELTDWEALAQSLHALGARRVVLVGPAPQWQPSLPAVIVAHHWKEQGRGRVADGLNAEVFDTDRKLRARYAESVHLQYISLIEHLCGEDGCLASPGANQQLMAVDSGHLSPDGSNLVAETILRPVLFGR